MTWIKLDDSFPDHPKVIGLSNDAFRLHIEALCYCGRFLTDGFVPMGVTSKLANGNMALVVELSEAGLWREMPTRNGFDIHDYLTYQSSKAQVEADKEANRNRVKKHQEKTNGITNALTNAFLMEPDTDTDTDTHNLQTSSEIAIAIPRVKSAKLSVESIQNKLQEARQNGINAWNISKLVEDEWDKLHASNDIGGAIALTVWYVSELQSRKLTASEIGRIGQMTKRFGRIALLAIDEAASKDLDDLVSYAFRVAQNLYKAKKVG